jgi:succinate dehydrogenase/fumarate reductase cytochrome b subunit
MKWLVKRWWFWLFLIVVTAVLVVHVYLAIWVRDYVNRKLSEIPGYRARVQALTLGSGPVASISKVFAER